MIKFIKKNKFILIAFMIIFILTATAITLAYMFRKTGEVKNDFTPASVSSSVFETFDGNEKSSIKVKNTGNIPAYIRVNLISYWVDENNNIVGKPSAVPVVRFDEVNWLKDSNGIYYFKNPVDPNGFTEPDLLTSPIILASETYHEKTVYQVVDVFAEAIQANPSKAAESAWGTIINSDKSLSLNQ